MATGRILFLVSDMAAGGAERVAALLCNHWVANGYDVILMPTYSGKGDCVFPLDPRVKLDFLADRVRSTGRSPLNAVRRLFALRRVMRETNPDVILSFLTTVNIAALVASVGLPTPVVISERTYPPKQVLSNGWAWLRRRLYRHADCVVAQTAATAAWIQENCPGSRTVVIPNPVEWPLQSEQPLVSPDAFVDRDRRLVLAAGRLIALKGFDDLIAAFAMLAPAFPEWDLAIVGEGPGRRRLETLREGAGLSKRVFLPGRVGNLGDWYNRADICTLTSHYEGFPNVIMEALAGGLPVVSMDCPVGPREIVRHGVDGFLVPEGARPQGLAQALEKLMTDSDLRKRFGGNATQARARFSSEKIGALWAAVLGL